jgi:hypothetical protein
VRHDDPVLFWGLIALGAIIFIWLVVYVAIGG